MAEFRVSGIVSSHDKQPYVKLATEQGMIAQLTMGQARAIAIDIIEICARTEADAMVMAFFEAEEVPEGVGVAMMSHFRDYRAQLDQEVVDRKGGPGEVA